MPGPKFPSSLKFHAEILMHCPGMRRASTKIHMPGPKFPCSFGVGYHALISYCSACVFRIIGSGQATMRLLQEVVEQFQNSCTGRVAFILWDLERRTLGLSERNTSCTPMSESSLVAQATTTRIMPPKRAQQPTRTRPPRGALQSWKLTSASSRQNGQFMTQPIFRLCAALFECMSNGEDEDRGVFQL